jgi:ABC-2 type transport system ATP-binding protein
MRLKEQQKTVFLNSHLLQEVELVCDRVAILDRGELRSVGTIDKITQGAEVAERAEVRFEIAGQEEAVRAALKDWQGAVCAPLGEGVYQVHIRLQDQAAVDQHVDDLRCSGISILGLTRGRVSLEDAFLNLLQPGGERL